jgi:hypothetical protein
MGTSSNKLVLSMGGELLFIDGEIVGAIGSAGASGAEDILVSQHCVELWNSLVNTSEGKKNKIVDHIDFRRTCKAQRLYSIRQLHRR